MDEKTQKEKLKEELAKLKKMTWKEKLGYIWDYYKPVMAGIIGVIVVICIIVQMVKGSQIVTELSAAFINGQTMGEEIDLLQEDFAKTAGFDGEKQTVNFDSSYVINLESADQMTTSSQTKLMAVIGAESLDVMVMPEDVYKSYLPSSAYMDLSQVMGTEFLEQHQEILCQDKQEEDTKEKVYGLKFKANEKLKPLYGNKTVVLAVVTNAKHTKNAEIFVKYLLS